MDKTNIIKLNQLGVADLHMHSCLSPCADLSMSPKNIVKYASLRGLSTIALTDHNSAKNCPAFKFECEKANITPLFGLEVNTKEEAHVLCITDELNRALSFDEVISEKIQKVDNNPVVFGDQPVLNNLEEVLYQVPYYLGMAVDISIDALFNYLDENHWLIIPSHVNRQNHSVISQLGFIPDLPFDAVEVSDKLPLTSSQCKLIENWIMKTTFRSYPVVRNSDLHSLDFC